MTHATRDAASSRPVVRSPRFSWATTPRRWLAGSTAATHIANGVNLLFPHGERFFVRSVRHYLRDVDDATLAEDVRAFFGQEGRHAGAHEAFFDVLREQGYEVDAFLVPYKRLSDRIEKASPPALRLAVTAALEHFTFAAEASDDERPAVFAAMATYLQHKRQQAIAWLQRAVAKNPDNKFARVVLQRLRRGEEDPFGRDVTASELAAAK